MSSQSVVNEMLAKILSTYKKPQDVDNAKDRLVGEDHYCWGCVWGTPLQDRVVCPFVEGSCARYPQTIDEPDPDNFDGMIETYRKKQRAKKMEAEAAENRRKAEEIKKIREQEEEEKRRMEERMLELERERIAMEQARIESDPEHIEHMEDRKKRLRKLKKEMKKSEDIFDFT